MNTLAGERVETVRAFFACPLPDSLVDAATGAQQWLTRLSLPLRVTPPSSLPVTTLFLGQVAFDAVMPVWQAARFELQGIHAARVRILDLATLPARRLPTVVIARLTDDPRLCQIHSTLRKVAASYDVPVDGRAFLPHLTLARVQGKASPVVSERVRMAQALQATEWSGQGYLDRVCLYRSIETPAGHRYRVLGDVQLQGGAT